MLLSLSRRHRFFRRQVTNLQDLSRLPIFYVHKMMILAGERPAIRYCGIITDELKNTQKIAQIELRQIILSTNTNMLFKSRAV